MTIVELREKRAKLWATMEGFLDTHRNDKGVLSTEDDAVYANMEKELGFRLFRRNNRNVELTR